MCNHIIFNIQTHRAKEFRTHQRGLTAHWVRDPGPSAATPQRVLMIPNATGLQS